MSWLYVTELGAQLTKKGGQYVVRRENETICEVPAALVEGVTLIDSVQVSSAVIVDFLSRGIPLTWLSTEGKFFGRLESTSHQNVLRQQKQFALTEDDAFAKALARQIIFGKIYNQMTVLRRYNRKAQREDVEKALVQIRAVADKLHRTASIEEIMGIEGIIARTYFSALSAVLPEEFRFEKRTRRPPEDPFNSMLSFGYTLLMYDFYNAILNCGLHPYVGFLHALRNGHPALASDLMEPWRPAVVDSFSASLVTHHEIRPEHFRKDEETGGVYLDRVGRRIFLMAYEKKMRSVNKYFGGSYSWRHTVGMECESYSLALERKDLTLLRPLIIR